jgi:hypothetical protein
VVLAATDTMLAAVSTSVRVIGCAHHNSPYAWSDAFVPITTSLTNFDVLMLFVTDNA